MEEFNDLADETAPKELEILSKEKWHIEAAEKFKNAQITGQALSVIFIDVDNLKDVNDTLNHSKGDEVIEDLRQSILSLGLKGRGKSDDSVHRHNDQLAYGKIGLMPGRIGGDEFAILCHTDSFGVSIIIDRLRNKFINYTDKELKELGIDISIGSSTLEARGIGQPGKEEITFSELLTKADLALYLDKWSHLKELSEDDRTFLINTFFELHKRKIRVRDLPKYEKKFKQEETNPETED